MSEEEEQERPAKETTEPMTEKTVTVSKSNTEKKLNTVGSAGLEKQPRLLTGNRLFGRLAGKTLESLASRQKTDSELKREEVGTKRESHRFGTLFIARLCPTLFLRPHRVLEKFVD